MTTEITAIAATAAPRGDGLFDVSAHQSAPANPPPAAVSAGDAQRQTNLGTGSGGSSGQPPTPGTLESVVDEFARSAAEAGAAVTFRIERDLNQVVISVVDRADGKVLRQIPSEEALQIARNLREGQGQGLTVIGITA